MICDSRASSVSVSQCVADGETLADTVGPALQSARGALPGGLSLTRDSALAPFAFLRESPA